MILVPHDGSVNNSDNECRRIRLTFAVGESPVARGTHGAVATNHVGPTAALAAERLAGVALCAGLVAATAQRTVVEERRQRCGRNEAEGRGGGRAAGEISLMVKTDER